MFIVLVCAVLVVVFTVWALVLFEKSKEPWDTSSLFSRVKAVLVSDGFAFFRSAPQTRAQPVQAAAVMPKSGEHDHVRQNANRLKLLEELLSEKNALIKTMGLELDSERAHRNEFEKILSLLQNQIRELREQNKKVRGEMDEVIRQYTMDKSGAARPVLISRLNVPGIQADSASARAASYLRHSFPDLPDSFLPPRGDTHSSE